MWYAISADGEELERSMDKLYLEQKYPNADIIGGW
jgi:hypothetical protein